jgi:spermidine synthase
MSRIKRSASTGLPTVNFSDHGPVRYLHLGTDWVQGSMWPDRPFDIHLDYVQRMMGWLLWVPPEEVAHLKAMQLGLGAGTLTKFCAHKLGMHTTAIEINPQVVAACRLWFKLPPDSERLQVVLGDAAEVAAHTHWRAQMDVLQVDLVLKKKLFLHYLMISLSVLQYEKQFHSPPLILVHINGKCQFYFCYKSLYNPMQDHLPK